MDNPLLTPSEVIVLCGDPFVDDIRAQDSTNERRLIGGRRVKAERLAVAAIRAAIVVSAQRGALALSWNLIRPEVEGLAASLEEFGGVPGKLLASAESLAVVQRSLDAPSPMIGAGIKAGAWPEQSIEALLCGFEPDKKNAVSVFEQLEQKLGGGQPVSSSGVVRTIKEGLVRRGLLEEHPRGFGLLQAGHRLPDPLKQPLMAHGEALQIELAAIRKDEPKLWDALAVSITICLNSGFV